jgi:hypothetical protein
LAAEVASPLTSATSTPPHTADAPQPPPDGVPSDAEAPDPQGTQSEASDPDTSHSLEQPAPRLSPQDDVDFLLHPAEIAKGRRAAENYLSSFRSEDSRRIAEEALETLATVISGGKCDSVEFPWQQVQPYHGAAALTILKEKGAPARIEALRCRRDTTRSYRVVPDSYPARQVQKIRSTLSKVIEECCELGFVETDEAAAATSQPAARTKKATRTKKSASRLLGDGELRALVAASASSGDAAGKRDAVLFSLVYRGLKIAEITALTPDSVRFSNKTGACTIVARPTGGGRGRRVELTNDELICLEDWLEARGDGAGPLLCTVGRGGKIEGKRLTTALLKEICLTRAEQAEVQACTPNDLSRSAQALLDHRKAARRRAARVAQETLSAAERALYAVEEEESPAAVVAQTPMAIRFPFLGLNI